MTTTPMTHSSNKANVWRFVEHSADGTHGFEGRFREVTPPERIV